jgi:hypothetical protein
MFILHAAARPAVCMARFRFCEQGGSEVDASVNTVGPLQYPTAPHSMMQQDAAVHGQPNPKSAVPVIPQVSICCRCGDG